MNHVVFAEPNNRAAKELEADALEQLGYQGESGIWQTHYLSAASELRNGLPSVTAKSGISTDSFKAMAMDLYFDYLGILLKGREVDGKLIVMNWKLTKPDEEWVLSLENSALTYMRPGRQSSSGDATLKLFRATVTTSIPAS